MNKYNFSFYAGGIKETIPQTNTFTLQDVYNKTRSDEYVEKIKAIRNGNKDLKATLDYITPSGIFKSRSNDNLIQRSCVFCLDFDYVNDLRIFKENLIKQLPPVLFFESPSGNGLKVFYYIDIDAGEHLEYFNAFQHYFKSEMNENIDKQCKDISRACFLSWDNNSRYNSKADSTGEGLIGKDFLTQYTPVVTVVPQKTVKTSTFSQNSIPEKCEAMRNHIDKSETFTNGNRNHYVGVLSAAFNRIGVPVGAALNYLMQFEQVDFDAKEINNIVKHTYKHTEFHACNPLKDNSQIATSANSANFATLINDPNEMDEKSEQLKGMPFLPDEIFELLPDILKTGCNAFDDHRRRDVFLTTALSILSGCMHNVSSMYNGEQVYANIYTFVIAPAASGKGSLASAKKLGNMYHRRLLEESQFKKKQYNIELQTYKKALNSGKANDTPLEMPEEPPFKILYIPANNSSARVIQHLMESEQQGIFCETEADSMGNVMKQDWGGYSDLLRKAFHHEPISYSRKTNKEFVEIEKPRLSVALAGTPSQVINLIKSSEDGLFSRFIFYTFKSDAEWIQASESSNGTNLTTHFDYLSEQVLNFVDFLGMNGNIQIKLTNSQWEQLNSFGSNSLITLSNFFSEDLASTSKRLGLILLRFCMILTALRYFDNSETKHIIHCSDNDFEIALKLIKVYEDHAVYMFNQLPKSSNTSEKFLKKFFDALPDKFQRKDAIELALSNFQIKERTADSYLSKLVTIKYLEISKPGHYEKIK